MSTIKKADIKVTPTPVRIIDRVAEASGASPPYIPPPGIITLIQHDPSFAQIIGDKPNHSLLISSEKPFFHEASVYTPSTSELWITSNGIPSVSAKGRLEKTIFISRLKLERTTPIKAKNSTQCHDLEHEKDGAGHSKEKRERQDISVKAVTWSKMRPPPGAEMPNGAVNASAVKDQEGILICAQGSRSAPGGIYLTSPKGTFPVVTNYLGRPFNSPNDVVVAKDGAIWFTDPSYGYDQKFKDSPQLLEQVYRYDPATGDCRVVADGFGRPNGIAFSPDETICYITDTSTSRAEPTDDPRRASTIYAFDVVQVGGQPQLTNRRVFAFVSVGFPDGIKTDLSGNVYSGCGDGVWAWNKGGLLLGKIATGDWVANFCFGEGGEMFLCNETKVWRVQLNHNVRGALLGELSIPV